MTVADQIGAILSKGGIATKHIDAYGRQIVITCWSLDAAKRATSVMKAATFRFRGIVKSLDENQENRNTLMNPTKHEVWRAYFAVH